MKPINTEVIKATARNGYNGKLKIMDYVLYIRRELFIYDAAGREVLHSHSSNVKSKEELVEICESFPDFLRQIGIEKEPEEKQ